MSRFPSLLFATCATGLVVAAAAWLQGAPEGAGGEPGGIQELAARPEVARALAAVDAQKDRILQDWIDLASTPSFSGDEGRRAEIVESRMKAAGLEDVHRDAAGNVMGILPGLDRKAKRTVFMAHMDTVAKPGADFTVRREDGILRGPGVRDDSSGLSATLTAARLAGEAGIVPPTDVQIVASVQEETGLNGSKAYMKEADEKVGAFVAVDGYLGQISYGATAIYWGKMHFRAPGAHTLRSYGSPSATLALARAIEQVYKISIRRHPEEMETWLNVGMVGGGEVPNAQARDAWFTVDLRSNDPAIEKEIEAKILAICEETARKTGVTFDHEVLQRLEGASIPGHIHSRIVQTARLVLTYLGWDEIGLTPRGTADHNIAIQRGIPAIAIGSTTGEGAHTPAESADIGPYGTGIKQIILMMASPLQ